MEVAKVKTLGVLFSVWLLAAAPVTPIIAGLDFIADGKPFTVVGEATLSNGEINQDYQQRLTLECRGAGYAGRNSETFSVRAFGSSGPRTVTLVENKAPTGPVHCELAAAKLAATTSPTYT